MSRCGVCWHCRQGKPCPYVPFSRAKRSEHRQRAALVDLAHVLILAKRRGYDPDVLIYRTATGQQRVAQLDHSRCVR